MSAKSHLYAKLLVKAFFPKVQKKIVEAAMAFDKPAAQAENVDTVAGTTLNQLQTPSNQQLDSHASDKNNPHRETAASIGTRTKSQVNTELNRMIPKGSIPIFTYGYIENASKAELDSR